MAERILKYTLPMQRGSDVLWLQERLRAHGQDPGVVDGIFGEKTLSALTAFQTAAGLLPADGRMEEAERAALARAAVGEEIHTGSRVADFIAYLKAQLGHIYVWGAQGEIVTSEKWIEKMETSPFNAGRAITLYRARLEAGLSPIRAYDCSGLIMRYLMERGLFRYDMSSRGLYGKCNVLGRGELKGGDLVFRHNGVNIYHVGVFVGDNLVVESKGRDDGVVMRDLNASGFRYWNRYGRLPQLGG